MREIKFRGKRLHNGEWVYGYYAYFPATHKAIILETNGYYVNEYGAIPETVGQFTGLKDCNGKEIYEGDVTDDNVGIGSVEYSEKYAGFRVNYHNGYCKWFYDYLDSEKRTLEIIGNIHENPELLKGGE